jgi:hypothetical protein
VLSSKETDTMTVVDEQLEVDDSAGRTTTSLNEIEIHPLLSSQIGR